VQVDKQRHFSNFAGGQVLWLVLRDPVFFPHMAQQSLPCFSWVVSAHVALVHQTREMLCFNVASQVAGHLCREGAGGANVEAATNLVERY